MTKTASLLTGIITGLITVLIIAEIFQWGVAALLSSNAALIINGIIFTAVYDTSGFVQTIFIVLSPLIFTAGLIELATFYTGKSGNDFYRIALIVFVLLLTGFMIFNVIFGIISILLSSSFETDWSILFDSSGLSYNQKLVMMLLILVMLFAYLNFSTKKMRRFIPVISKKNEHE